ncbi:hypothetical protein PS870_02102 [Pseudomonas fluorescens]|uniref:Uncharacterized protein n=1 Tax=Pseudomonas fluorescens TaxID=294 RepID=A0A5E7JUT7_PSEFL|nr:hypothetical protein PS870_02102 [Pseudomonas fluorescens]
MGWRRGPHRWQASSHRVRCSPASHWSAVRPPSRASLAPTRIQRTAFDFHHSSGRALARLQLGRHRWQASSYRVRCSPASHWSAVRLPSRASLAPTRGSLYTLRSSPLIRPSVSSPAAWPSSLASQLPQVRCSPASQWSAVRPPSRASLAPTRIQRTAFDSHHSSGRALARLQLLILIHPPLSGG